MKVSIKDFAAMLDVSQPAISHKIKKGYLGDAVIVGANGRKIIDVEKAMANLKKHQPRDNALVKAAQRERAQRELEAIDTALVDSSPQDSPPAVIAGGVVTDYGTAQSKRESYLAEIARLKYEALEGQLVAVEDVRKQAFLVFRETQAAVLTMPTKCAPVIAGMDDVFEITQYLDKFVREVLTELSNQVSAKYAD